MPSFRRRSAKSDSVMRKTIVGSPNGPPQATLMLTNSLHPATLIRCHLVYLREWGEKGQETESRTRNGPANNFSGGKETLSREPLIDWWRGGRGLSLFLKSVHPRGNCSPIS